VNSDTFFKEIHTYKPSCPHSLCLWRWMVLLTV